MSKVLRMTPEIMEGMRRDFETALQSGQIVDGVFSFTKSFKSDDRKAVLRFTPEAYAKMTALVQAFEKEVAWHCVTKRCDDPNTYLVYDILVYPQTVAAATVDMDVQKYAEWCEAGLRSDDDRFFNLYGQGHSHVNMATNPSPTDLTHQRGVLKDLRPTGFYVFIIWNKRNDHSIWIYDLMENIVYEDKDITLQVGDMDLTGFIADAKELVKIQTYPSYQKWNDTYVTPAKPVVSSQQAPVSVTPAPKKKEKAYTVVKADSRFYDDDNDPTSPFFVKDHFYGME